MSAEAVDCDKTGATNLKIKMLELATWDVKGSRIDVYWKYPVETMTKQKRLELISTFANTDACLSGEARHIRFYRNKKLIAVASPVDGIRLAD